MTEISPLEEAAQRLKQLEHEDPAAYQALLKELAVAFRALAKDVRDITKDASQQ